MPNEEPILCYACLHELSDIENAYTCDGCGHYLCEGPQCSAVCACILTHTVELMKTDAGGPYIPHPESLGFEETIDLAQFFLNRAAHHALGMQLEFGKKLATGRLNKVLAATVALKHAGVEI